METLVTLFSQKTKLVFKITFSILLLSKIFYYEWVSWIFSKPSLIDGGYLLPTVIFFIMLFGLPVCLVSMVITLIIQFRRKELGKRFLCVFLLLLPLTDAYEALRFYSLRPIMEKAAIETAKEYQDALLDDIGTLEILLPFPYRGLSRDSHVTLAVDNSQTIRIAFLQYEGLLFTNESEYIYQTEIPYQGKSTYFPSYPDPEYTRGDTSIYKKWKNVLTFITLSI